MERFVPLARSASSSSTNCRAVRPELVERATLWDRWHAGRSGRTARQFVDELEAELESGTSLYS